eukprot:2735214-Pyramimonas_sp.AAC.1
MSHSSGVNLPALPCFASSASISALAACAFANVRHARKTWFPAAASCKAPAYPIPELDPVMMMFLLLRGTFSSACAGPVGNIAPP